MDSHIRILKALHGDSFILHCKKGENDGIVVVDGGPHQDSYKIKEALEEYSNIDLMVITHYDDDHIGGILDYIESHKDDRPFPVKEIWVNTPQQITVSLTCNISFSQARNLSRLLSDINKDLESKDMPLIQWNTLIMAGQEIHKPYADFLILSPEEESLRLNFENFEKECGNISNSHHKQKEALAKTLKELSLLPKKDVNLKSKQEVINLSSIAFVVTCDDYSALMLGDSYPSAIVKTLNAKGFDGENNKLCVDYIKIAHHGSAKNTSNALLDLIECDTFVISTNGGNGVSCHPDRETIGNITWHPNRDHSKPVNLVFGYPLDDIETIGFKFLNKGEEEQNESFFVVHPDIEYLPL